MTRNALTVAELVDLEARVAADRQLEPEALRARDRGVYAAMSSPPTDRAQLLSAWLGGLGDARPGLGEQVARAHRVVGAALAVLGGLTGWGASAWVLGFDGERPVNVAVVLAVLVLGQLAVLLLAVGVALLRAWPRLAERAALVGDLRDLLRWFAAGLTRLLDRAAGATAAEPRQEWAAAWHRLRSRRSLYRSVEVWTLFGLLQGFGVAFNVGALVCFTGLVVFSDLAFAWSTTLSLDAETFGGLARALAAPWGWLWPAGVPSEELVELSRYSRLEAAYAGATAGRAIDPTLVGAWWRFLFAAVAFYGLLPRLTLLLVARHSAARALRDLPLDTPDVDAVLRRLTAARVSTQAVALEITTDRGDDAAPGGESASDERYFVLLWRDVPIAEARFADVTHARFGGAVAARLAVGDYAAEEEAVVQLGTGREPVLVVAEAWEAPDKAVRRFLGRLRAEILRDRPIVLGLVGEADTSGWAEVASADLRVWRRHLAALEDPYLSIEALGSV